VPIAGLCAEASHLVHAASGRRASFGQLVDDALRRPVPEHPALKPCAQRRRLGKEHVGRDVAAIVHGTTRYGLDQRPTGMLFATIERVSCCQWCAVTRWTKQRRRPSIDARSRRGARASHVAGLFGARARLVASERADV
jgi:hypothetical protein